MSATVLPFLQRCPACFASGWHPHHPPTCTAETLLGSCLCVPVRCELCEGMGLVEPRMVTVWVHDMGRGLLDGWAAGVRP